MDFLTVDILEGEEKPESNLEGSRQVALIG